MSQKPLVEVKNLSVSFPVSGGIMGRKVAEVKAVDDISFSIGKSEIVGLVGESGCGKTTVGRAMINILKYIAPDVEVDGEILYHFDGEDVDFNMLHPRRMRKYRPRVQMIFQDPYASLNPRMTVAQIVEEPLKIHLDLSSKKRRERVLILLEKVGLRKDHAGRFPHEFSGGQRQRVGIARALATNPDLIICDEPVSALDVSVQAQVLNLLNELKEEFGLTYIFISHDLSVVKYMSDRMVVMQDGKIEELGDADQIYNEPKTPYTQKLIDAIPEGKLEDIKRHLESKGVKVG